MTNKSRKTTRSLEYTQSATHVGESTSGEDMNISHPEMQKRLEREFETYPSHPIYKAQRPFLNRMGKDPDAKDETTYMAREWMHDIESRLEPEKNGVRPTRIIEKLNVLSGEIIKYQKSPPPNHVTKDWELVRTIYIVRDRLSPTICLHAPTLAKDD